MAKVRTVFSSDDKDVQAALDRMTRATQKLQDENRKLRQETKRGSDSFSGDIKKGVGQLKDMAVGLVSVQSAVNAVKSAWSDWRNEMDQIAAKHRQFTNSLQRDLAESGDIFQGARVSQFLRTVPGLTKEEAQSIYRGVRGGDPGATIDRVESLVRAAAPQDVTGVDLEDLGAVVGEMSRVFQEKTADDIVDIATKLRADAGSRISKVGGAAFVKSVETLMGTGAVSPEEALGFGLESLVKGMRPDSMEQVASAIGKEIEKTEAKRVGGRMQQLTPDQVMMNRLADMNASERFQAILSDPEVAKAMLGDEQATKLRKITLGSVRERATALSDAQEQNFANKMADAATRFQEGAEFAQMDAAEARKERAQRPLARFEDAGQRAQAFIEAQIADDNAVTQMVARGVMKARRFFGAGADNLIDYGLQSGLINEQDAEQFRAGERDATFGDVAPHLRQQLAEMKKMNATLDQIKSRPTNRAEGNTHRD